MNARDYCFWMQGYCELTRNKPPTHAQWKMIIEHLELLKGVDRSGYGYDDFTEMLQGFIAINGINKISDDQWLSITEKLQDCFEKVTSTLKDLEKESPFMSPEDIQDILKEVVREQQTHPCPPPPYIPQPNPLNPFPDPKQPWKTPDIICSDSKAFCASVPDVACNVVEVGESLVEFARETAKANLEDAYDSHNIDSSLTDDSYWR